LITVDADRDRHHRDCAALHLFRVQHPHGAARVEAKAAEMNLAQKEAAV